MSGRLFDDPVWRAPAPALRTHPRFGVVVPDRPAPLFRFGDPDHAERASVIARVLERGGTDREAWAILVAESGAPAVQEPSPAEVDPEELVLL